MIENNNNPFIFIFKLLLLSFIIFAKLSDRLGLLISIIDVFF